MNIRGTCVQFAGKISNSKVLTSTLLVLSSKIELIFVQNVEKNILNLNVFFEKKMGEINIHGKILRELRSKHSLSELNSKQRRELRVFCETWDDVLADLSSIGDTK